MNVGMAPVAGQRPSAAVADAQQYLTFNLGDQSFAIDISAVREIVQQTEWTAVPLMPDFVRGIMNLRGSVVPIIDLQVRFGRERSPMSKKTCVVIFDLQSGNGRNELGLLVDSVSEVVEMQTQDIQPPPNFGNTISRDYIRGIGKLDGQFMVILAPETAFSLEDMAMIVDRAAAVSLN